MAKPGQGALTRVFTTTGIFYGARPLDFNDGSVFVVAWDLCIIVFVKGTYKFTEEDNDVL